MRVSVWDTYVRRTDGKVMHFDILVPSTVTNEATIFGFGKQYLNTRYFPLENSLPMNVNFVILNGQRKKWWPYLRRKDLP